MRVRGLRWVAMSLGHSILVLVVWVLAVARVTRLVNFDVVADPVRVWVAGRAAQAQAAGAEAATAGHTTTAAAHVRREGRWNTAAYLLGCPWCVGFWVALCTVWVPVALIGWPWWSGFGVALAGSHLVGVAAPLADGGEDLAVEPAEHA